MQITPLELEELNIKALWIWYDGMPRQERIQKILDPQYRTAFNKLFANCVATDIIDSPSGEWLNRELTKPDESLEVSIPLELPWEKELDFNQDVIEDIPEPETEMEE